MGKEEPAAAAKRPKGNQNGRIIQVRAAPHPHPASWAESSGLGTGYASQEGPVRDWGTQEEPGSQCLLWYVKEYLTDYIPNPGQGHRIF